MCSYMTGRFALLQSTHSSRRDSVEVSRGKSLSRKMMAIRGCSQEVATFNTNNPVLPPVSKHESLLWDSLAGSVVTKQGCQGCHLAPIPQPGKATIVVLRLYLIINFHLAFSLVVSHATY